MKKMKKDNNGRVTKKDLWKCFWSQMFFELGSSALKMEAPGFVTAMVPIIEKVYDKKEDKIKAYKRHAEYYLSEGRVAGLNIGIAAAMEERLATENDIDPESINAVKSALMGPLAAIGDSIFHGTLRPLFAGIACSLVVASNYSSIVGPLIFVFVMTLLGFIIRYYATFQGYYKGTQIVDAIQNSGLIHQVTRLAGIAAYLLVGGFSYGLVSLNIPVEYTFESTVVSLQEMLDGLCPGLLPMLLIVFMYFLMDKKKVNPVLLLIMCLAVGVIGVYCGFLVV